MSNFQPFHTYLIDFNIKSVPQKPRKVYQKNTAPDGWSKDELAFLLEIPLRNSINWLHSNYPKNSKLNITNIQYLGVENIRQ